MTVTSTQLHPAIQQTEQYIAHTYGRPEFVLTGGKGMEVYDSNGKTYLDFVAGIAVVALGHGDEQLINVIQEAAAQLLHVSNLYYTQPAAELATRLCQHSFADRVFLCNSGAEANEACIKFARKYAYAAGHTDKTEIIAFSGAFHGRTMGALATTPREKYQAPFKPLMPDVTILPFNDIETAQAAITDRTCAVLVEPVQGEGGIHPATPEFLQALRERCDTHNALLIFDEVQCGLGRTGTLWAYELSGVTPDLMALAKPLAGGLPIGAALMTENVHSVVKPGDHGSTFAGGPLVTSAAAHVFDRINTPKMLTHVQEMSAYLQASLQAIPTSHITAIRGHGLMLAVDLDFPATELINAGYDAGILLVNAGENTLRLVPPLIVEKTHIDTLIQFLTAYLTA